MEDPNEEIGMEDPDNPGTLTEVTEFHKAIAEMRYAALGRRVPEAHRDITEGITKKSHTVNEVAGRIQPTPPPVIQHTYNDSLAQIHRGAIWRYEGKDKYEPQEHQEPQEGMGES